MYETALAGVVPVSETPSHHLDARGLYCPEPVMLLHNAVRDMAAGELLEVRASDPSTQRDIPRFCQFLGHQLVLEEEVEGEFRYLIRKQ
ncbi:MAG: sulfurtransferase TusA [Halieaceae bacterium]